MNYKNYKRQLVISQVLDKPLEGKYLKAYNSIEGLFKSLDLFESENEYPSHKFYLKEEYMFHIRGSMLYISQKIINRFVFLFKITSQNEAVGFIVRTINHYLETSFTFEYIRVLADFEYRKYDVHFSTKYKHDNRVRNKIIWH